MEKILVSACLLGQKCRYDGKTNEMDYFEVLNQHFDLVPFCPEMVGGLPCPRPRSEIKGSQVVSELGKTVTKQFEEGARKALEVCAFLGITRAILKEDSPSCGVHFVHDGYFRNKIVAGQGITARYLKDHGINVMNEVEGKAFLDAYLAHLESKPVYQQEQEEAKPDKKKDFKKWKSQMDRVKIAASRKRSDSFHPSDKKPRGKKNFGKKPYRKDFHKKETHE